MCLDLDDDDDDVDDDDDDDDVFFGGRGCFVLFFVLEVLAGLEDLEDDLDCRWEGSWEDSGEDSIETEVEVTEGVETLRKGGAEDVEAWSVVEDETSLGETVEVGGVAIAAAAEVGVWDEDDDDDEEADDDDDDDDEEEAGGCCLLPAKEW